MNNKTNSKSDKTKTEEISGKSSENDHKENEPHPVAGGRSMNVESIDDIEKDLEEQG